MGPLSTLRIHVHGISAGDRPFDRVAIAVLVGLRALSPLWRLFDRLHLRVPSPLHVIPRYRIREGVNRWEVDSTEGAAYLSPGLIDVFKEAERNLSGVCIDVGAAFGWFTVRWARQIGAGGRVVALEPSPRHYSSLVRNVALNELTNIIALPCAVGDHEGSLTLFSPAFGLSTYDASAIIDGGGPRTEVPLRTIDRLCDELGLTDICLVKIDVEFYEPNVLRGMKRIVERDRPTILFEALTTEAFAACRAELPDYYEIRHLFQADYVARPRPSIETKQVETS